MSTASINSKLPAVALELKGVSKRFGAREVFQDISISVGSGCLVVSGRNGSGKSTLLKIIAGLMQPTEGEVVFTSSGEKLPLEIRRSIVGLVAPDLSLYDELSAIENLRFFARVRGIDRPENDLRAILADLGLKGREDDRLGAYSSGMKQRVKYAFAIMHTPPVLLLDEPSANLDKDGVEIVDGIIRRWKTGGIVVIATNEASELGYADRALELGT